jgi:hypothetical protein
MEQPENSSIAKRRPASKKPVETDKPSLLNDWFGTPR